MPGMRQLETALQKECLIHFGTVRKGFVILDDGDYEWHRHGFDKHLVKTDFCTGGLRAEDADRAIRILNKKRLFSFFRKY